MCICAVGKPVKLSLAAEEVALFFAQMLDHDYTTKDVFRDNFFKDWRKVGGDVALLMNSDGEGHAGDGL